MKLIETYNGSGFFAQYASSADYDSLGNPLSSYMIESKFGFNNNLITGYNGSGFAGGGGNYHSASATVTNTGTNFTITLSSNNSYVVLDSNDVTGTQSLNITIVPPTLEANELLDCIVQFSPVGGTSTTGHTVSADGLIQVGLRKYNIGGLDLNYIKNGETAQIRLLGNTYCLM